MFCSDIHGGEWSQLCICGLPGDPRTHSSYSKCALMAAWDRSACSFRALANELMMRSCYLPGLNSSFVVCELASCKLCVCSLRGKQSDLLIDRNLIMMLTVKQAGSHRRWMGNNSLPSPVSAVLYVNTWTHKNRDFHYIYMLNTPGRAV